MKTILIIIFLTSGICYAQKNALYVTFQPVDFGVGLRYDRKITEDVGIYASGSYGKFRLPHGGYIKDHMRAVAGGLFYLKPYNNSRPSFGVGLIYSYYGERYITMPDFPDKAFDPISFELSFTTYCYRRFAIGIRFDFLKNESALDFGIRF
jgi:hypothetical protein